MAIKCDTSMLSPADGSFVVVADTHYFAEPGRADADAVAEFPSRGVQGERAAAVWQTIANLDPAFVVHMGDLVQEYPGRTDFADAQSEALAQIDAVGLRSRIHFVAGNHDVGDKPDQTMPTHAVGAADLVHHEANFGESFEQWSCGGFRFLSINSQIFNTDLASASRQRQWLARELAADPAQNLVVFLHLPPYLRDAGDPHLGHYDTIAEPDRHWLLAQLRQTRLHHLFAAHVHFRFYDQIPTAAAAAHYWICASSCFTRPGFGQLFAAPPAPERGRNDVPKLGFYHCQMRDGQIDVLFVPTGDGRATHERVLTSAQPERGQRLGVTLTHPLVTQAQVPIAYPSLVRQPVRNDYPLLLIREMGVSTLRVPGTDMTEPLQRSRLQWLRRQGFRLQATAVGLGAAAQLADTQAGAFDRLEVQLTDGLMQDAHQQSQLSQLSVPLALCAIVPGDRIGGKQHPRTRVGYRAAEIDQLPARLAEADVVLVMCGQGYEPLTQAGLVRPATSFGLQVRLALEEEAMAPLSVMRALVLATAWDAPVFLEPIIDLDRTMDAATGLLDPLCNPRPAYETARLLAALLANITPTRIVVDEQECVQLEGSGGMLRLWPTPSQAAAEPIGRWYSLTLGAVATGASPPAHWWGPVAWLAGDGSL